MRRRLCVHVGPFELIAATVLAGILHAQAARAIEPRPTGSDALWSGETWGQIQVIPAITKAANSVTVRATVVGGPAGNPSWHCSQYSGWVAAGTSSIYFVIPEDWSFTSGESFVRSIGGRVTVQDSSAGDPPPYGWEDRVSDTCYCSVGTFGASGGCATREVLPTFAKAFQQEIVAPSPLGRWVRIDAGFSGWNGVAWGDTAVSYVYVMAEGESLEDVDGDGLADVWEIAHFGNLTTAGVGTSYPDDDDVDDQTEYANWLNDTTDGDGLQYDPTAKNTAPGSGTGGVGCGSLNAATLGAAGLGVFALRLAGRRRRQLCSVARASCPSGKAPSMT